MATEPDPASRLDDETLREIAAQGVVRGFPAGQVIIREGDLQDALYVVLSGRVKVHTTGADGRDLVLATLGPGELLGELALDGGERSASVTTLEPCRCALVRSADLQAFVSRHPAFARHLILKLIGRVRRLTHSARSLALDDARTRIAALLARHAVDDGDARVVVERWTQQDIADRVGTSREMVSRVFKEMVRDGELALDGRRLRLLGPREAR